MKEEIIDKCRSKIKMNELKKKGMVEYVRMKLEEEDFHGVADGAMDLRDLAAESKFAEEVIKSLETHAAT